MSSSLRLHGLYSIWNSPGQNTGVDSLSLLQGIFPTRDLTQVPCISVDSLPAEPPGRPIFVYGMRKCSNLVVLSVAAQFFQNYLWKDSLSPILYSCLLCHRLGDLMCVGLSLGSLLHSIDLCVCFCANTVLF